MKRLLAYLFLVLGLGLVVNNFAFAWECIEGNCINGQGTIKIKNWGARCPSPWRYGLCFFDSGTKGKYVGQFKNRYAHGQGTYTDVDGSKYAGEWKNSYRHGQGTYTWANGDKYVGEYKDNKKHGQGTETHINGTKYVGEWKDDKHHEGTYTFADGRKYVGEWKGYSRHGQGTFTHADGRIDNGIWKNGKLVERNNIKTQIAKVEPSQTQEVVNKDTYFCDNTGTTRNQGVDYFIPLTINVNQASISMQMRKE